MSEANKDIRERVIVDIESEELGATKPPNNASDAIPRPKFAMNDRNERIDNH
jgi:hypothetical protein